MPLTLLYSSDNLDLHFDAENEWLYLDWKGPQELELVQEACEYIIGFVEQTGARKALNDNTHITETSWELARWIAYDYLPQVAEAGVEHIAWVSSPLLSCRTNVDVMATFSDRKPHVAIFDDVSAAFAWLSSISVFPTPEPL